MLFLRTQHFNNSRGFIFARFKKHIGSERNITPNYNLIISAPNFHQNKYFRSSKKSHHNSSNHNTPEKTATFYDLIPHERHSSPYPHISTNSKRKVTTLTTRKAHVRHIKVSIPAKLSLGLIHEVWRASREFGGRSGSGLKAEKSKRGHREPFYITMPWCYSHFVDGRRRSVERFPFSGLILKRRGPIAPHVIHLLTSRNGSFCARISESGLFDNGSDRKPFREWIYSGI